MPDPTPSSPTSDSRAAARLFVFAMASLYLELAIIRFAGAEVLYLAYFSNFVLISAFVGLGLGFVSYRRAEEGGVDLAAYLPFFWVFLFALILISPFDVSELTNQFGLFFFGNLEGVSGLPGWILLVLLFISTVAIFAGLGRELASLFPRFSPLKAYTLDIGGSLAGIVLFSLQSMVWSGPITWIVTGTLLLALAYLLGEDTVARRRVLHTVGAGIATVVLLLSGGDDERTLWSPYQKLEWRAPGKGVVVHIYANSVLHQFIHPALIASNGYYSLPYKRVLESGGRLDDVLIIGAGSGTDVASALLAGAKRVDAVEIDPGIVFFGRQLNGDQPYADPRVNLTITDGREFLRNTDRQYDLVVFALPDSLLRLGQMSNLRLESYLFTLECFEDVKRHLKPGGTVAAYNSFRWEWLRDRIAGLMQLGLGVAPERSDHKTTTMFLASTRFEGERKDIESLGALPTDDWPFVYMQEPAVHWLYLAMILLFLLSALGGIAIFAPKGTLRRPAWPYFFMGAAFLLLETKSISLFSLLFGTTWLVNSLAFGGVLCSVLAANFVVHKFSIGRKGLLFGLLMGAFAIAWLVPTRALLAIELAPLRFAASVGLVFAPIFLANLIFSREFRDEGESVRAFGWNLLGAVAGGGLEYMALLVGQRNLLFFAAAFYSVVAYYVLRRRD